MLEHILVLLAEWTVIGVVAGVTFGFISRRMAREEEERESDEQA
jgi:hypothetical protein